MKKNKIFFAFACSCILFAALTGCNNSPADDDNKVNGSPKSSEKQILTFLFLKEDNTAFTDAGALGTIDELSKKIGVILSTGTDITKLKARFRLSDGAKASVNGKTQESGKTENDFTAPVNYTITAEDGSTQIYIVQVTVAPAKPDVPEGITEKAFADLPADQQAEVQSLYGYYWSSDGTKSECPAINADRLGVYTASEFMSMGFTNLRWSKVSSSTWACFSYAEDDEDYGAKRLIFTFMKDADGTIWLWDTIVAMGGTYGPYVKGKIPDTFEEGDKTYYTYDKATYDKNPKRSPKLFDLTMK